MSVCPPAVGVPFWGSRDIARHFATSPSVLSVLHSRPRYGGRIRVPFARLRCRTTWSAARSMYRRPSREKFPVLVAGRSAMCGALPCLLPFSPFGQQPPTLRAAYLPPVWVPRPTTSRTRSALPCALASPKPTLSGSGLPCPSPAALRSPHARGRPLRLFAPRDHPRAGENCPARRPSVVYAVPRTAYYATPIFWGCNITLRTAPAVDSSLFGRLHTACISPYRLAVLYGRQCRV